MLTLSGPGVKPEAWAEGGSDRSRTPKLGVWLQLSSDGFSR